MFIPEGFVFKRPGDKLVFETNYQNDAYQIKNLIKDFDIIIDIGAHIGTVSRFCLDNGAKHVVGVEAHPDGYSSLVENCGMFSNFEAIYGFATSEQYSKTRPLTREYDKTPFSEKHFILSEFLKPHIGKKICVKIDIEGWEYAVLLDLKINNLYDKIDYIIGEYHHSETPEIVVIKTNEDVVKFFNEVTTKKTEFRGMTKNPPYILGEFIIK